MENNVSLRAYNKNDLKKDETIADEEKYLILSKKEKLKRMGKWFDLWFSETARENRESISCDMADIPYTLRKISKHREKFRRTIGYDGKSSNLQKERFKKQREELEKLQDISKKKRRLSKRHNL